MHGLHLIADLTGCAAERRVMRDAAALRACCMGAVQAAGLHAVGERFHSFAATADASDGAAADACGVTGVVLLAESHVAVHTWPELGAVTLDVYVCNRGTDNRARAHALLQALCAAFAPQHVHQQAVQRGALGALDKLGTPGTI